MIVIIMIEAEFYLLLALGCASLFVGYLYRRSTSHKKNPSPSSKCSVHRSDEIYSVPVNDNPAERRLKFYENENGLMRFLYADAKTMLEAVQRGARVSENGNFLGKINHETKSIEWITYRGALNRMKHFADGLLQLGLIPVKSVVGIYSTNRPEYAIVEYGCYWHSMVIAPIYNTLGPNVATFIANHAEIELIVCDTMARVEAVLSQASDMTCLKYIVCMDSDDDIPKCCTKEANNLNVKIFTLKQLEQLGVDNPAEPNHPNPENVAVICYTSGTTGDPKGVIHTHENVISTSSGLLYQTYEHIVVPSDVFLSYLPLAHILERAVEVAIQMLGAKIVYFSGDIPNIVKDIQIARPTILLAVPRMLNKIYDKIHDNVRGNPLKEWMLRTALAVKQQAYEQGRVSRNTIWDRLIFDKIRNNLGGRVRIVATGSATLDPHVGEVLRNVLDVVLNNGYGQTECGVCCSTVPFDKKTDNVGPPLATTLIKLVDIPEMNYYVFEGKGEILVKGPSVSRGYHKDPIKSAELFDNDGWMRTGDVGAWTPEGNLQVIDRMKNHFKLSLGEYIPVEKLEVAYGLKSLFVSQIFVYGDGLREYLVAIIVPEMDYLHSWCKLNKLSLNLNCKKIKQSILADLQAIALKEKFNKFEHIRKVHLHRELFSIEDNLLTPTMKLKKQRQKEEKFLMEMSAPKELSVIWRNFDYEVNDGYALCGKSSRKPILQCLNGAFEYHSLNGLMGPSGAGKSTLLNCLSARKQSGLSENSEIYFNRQKSKPKISNRSIVYFIEQHVHQSILGCLTVGEIFRYAYGFKNNKNEALSMNKHIRQILVQLMFDESILERKFENCSGGEQKRIAIGQELMTRNLTSAILFVDEPTTGLDSASSVQVISVLKKLTKLYRMSVIASIHVPSEEILGSFDQLYVLAKGGVCIYSGMPLKIKPTLNLLLPELTISAEQSPIEVMIQMACNGTSDLSVAKLAHHFNDKEFMRISNKISQIQPNLCPPHVRLKCFSFTDLYLQFSRQFRTTFIAQYRTQLALIVLYLFYYTILATVFNSEMATASSCLALKDENGQTCGKVLENEILYKENISYLSYAMLFVGLVVVCNSAVVFSSGLNIFRSEHRNYWYSVGVYYWSTVLISILEMLLNAIFTSIIAYFITFQNGVPGDYFHPNWPRLLMYIYFMCLYYLHAKSTGQLIGAVLMDYRDYSIVFGIVYCMLALMMNGIFVDTEHSGILINIGSSFVALKFPTFGILNAIYGFGRCDPATEFSFVLQYYGIEEIDVWNYSWYTVAYVCLAQALTLSIIWLRFRESNQKTNFKFQFTSQKRLHLNVNNFVKGCESQVSFRIPMKNREMIQDGAQTEKLNSTILGWTNLTLYSSSSIYEMGYESKNLSNDGRRPILCNLNGQVKYGTLNALMGTSGAGKTTLLKALNGQLRSQISDETHFYLSTFRKIQTCFITQEVSNHLWTGLTAKQLLVYSSRLKNPELSESDHNNIVDGLLEELNLIETANTKVDQCSGGERKRLALALELTSAEMPNLICIDEPTSGLDSNSSEIVLKCLRQLTRSHNLTIIASIHQPNCAQLRMFDQLYVLARGGVCIFAGHAAEIPNCLDNVLSHGPKKVHHFPIEEIVKYSCADQQDETVQKFVEYRQKNFDKCERETLQLDTHRSPDGVQGNRKRFTLYSTYILTLRYVAYIYGHLWKEYIFYLCNYFIYAYILVWLYDRKMFDVTGCIDLAADDLNSTCTRNKGSIEATNHLLNNSRYNFFVVVFYLFFVLIQTSLTFKKELVYFENEHRNGWYSSGSYYLMKCIMETMPLLPINLIYVYLCDHYEHIRPGIYWELVFFLTLSAIGFQALAHICAILCAASLNALIVLVVILFLVTTMISNFFLSYSRMHYFYQFLSQFSISKFLFESLMLLQYGFGRCGRNEIQASLYVMKLVDEDLRYCVWMLLFNLIVFRVVALCMLISKVNPLTNAKQRAKQIVQYRKQLTSNYPVLKF